MNKKDFIDYAEKLQQVEDFLRICTGAESFSGIQWETDPKKIDLSVLASGECIPNRARMYIQQIKMSQLTSCSEFNLEAEALRYKPLYQLIKDGVKIIPPMARIPCSVVNGEVKQHYNSIDISIVDGGHRIALARALNMETIPVLFIEDCRSYEFERRFWDAKQDENSIIFKNKADGSEYRIDMNNVYPSYSRPYFWIFDAN